MSQPLRYPRPRSLARLGPRHNVVESSAGTGKTFLLEHRFIDLMLSHGIPADQILVVTFTEKATAELVLRLRKLVLELAELEPGHAKLAEAAAAPTGETWLIDDQARRRLDQALLAFDRNSIFTIHGFCQRVLREHAFVQGRLFDEELAGANAVFGQAFAEVLRTRVATDAGLAVLLGAWLEGGKTIAELRELLLACAGAPPGALRPIFDENRLALALAAWRPVAVGEADLQYLLKTAKVRSDVAARCLERLARLSRLVASCGGDVLRFLAELHVQGDGDSAYVSKSLQGKNLDPRLEWLPRQTRELDEASVPLQAVLAQRLLPAVLQLAAERKRKSGYFDYDDMLALVDQALADPGPAGRALLASLRERYRHALIDEFQDTDEIQWSIFRRIFVEAGDEHALTVIGDAKQAIYGFRGANVFTYLEARRALQDGGAGHLVLDRNFRSTAGLIAAVNSIFEQSANFFRRESGISYEQPVTCGRPQRQLLGRLGEPASPVVIFELQTAADKLCADHARAALGSAIAGEVRELLSGASPLRLRDGETERALQARDVFILTFTNNDSQVIGHALRKAGLDFAFYKQDELFQTSEATEILDVLRAICAPQDRGAAARALLTRFFAMDLAEVAACTRAGQATGPARQLLHLAEKASTSDVPTFFSSLVEETGVLRREVFAGEDERGLTNIMHVLELLQGQWAKTHAALPELVDLLDAYVRGTQAPPGGESDMQRLETDRNAVQILTVHKAKGLEADVVFVYGGTGQRNNTTHALHESGKRVVFVGKPTGATKRRIVEELDDERSRLLYVAATRARFRLYLPHYPAQLKIQNGSYARMNVRLGEILGAEPSTARQFFERRRVDCATNPEHERAAAPAPTTREKADLLALPSEPALVAAIRDERRGFLVTSYTTVKRARAGMAPVEEAAQLPNPGEQHANREPVADALPGGAGTGIFLHEILAAVSLGELAARPSFASWFGDPALVALLAKLRRRHARPMEEIPAAGRLVHAAYTTPVDLGGTVIPALASATRALREMEFLYPMPEQAHPLLGAPASQGAAAARTWKIERGAVKGFIDLLFEHEGRVHVCDWKSDILTSYDAATLGRHCAQHYDVQTRLYTIAALRFAGITSARDYESRFGAVVFCFLRGRDTGDARQGIYRLRPAWDELLAWQSDMLGQPFWGLAR